MSWRLLWFVFFIHCWIVYTCSEDDVKVLSFSIDYNKDSRRWECNGNILNLLVGDQFKISTYLNNKIMNDVGRCYKSQENEFGNTSFSKKRNNVYVSHNSITVTKAKNWEFVCIFYTEIICESFKNNICYGKWRWNEDKGIKCTSTIRAEDVVIPSGYLIAGTTNFTSSSEENIYKYYDGENINFTCSKTTGRTVGLLYVGNGIQNKSNTQTDSTSFYMTMGPENDNTTLICFIIGDKKTKQVVTLKLILDENKLGFWIIVLGVVLIVLLLPCGLWILKKKRLRKNDLPVVHYENLSSFSTTPNLIPDDATYTEPYKFNDAQSEASENTTKEHHTYVNSQELKDELIYASVQDGASNHITIQKNEKENATRLNSKSVNLKKHDKEADTTVKISKDIFENVKNQKPKLEQMNVVEQSIEINDIKVKVISAKAQKPKIKTKKPKLLSVKSYEPKPKVIEPNFASVKTKSLNFATINNSDIHLKLVKNTNYKDNKLQDNTAVKQPELTCVNENTLKNNNVKKLKVKIRQDKKIVRDEGNTKEPSKIPESGKKSKKYSRENKEDSSNLNSIAFNIEREEERLGITYAELAHGNLKECNFVVVSKLPEYSKVKAKKHDYENVKANTDIEPAYCEIINQ